MSHGYTFFFLYILEFSHSYWVGKRRSQKFHPTFIMGSSTQQANELLIRRFLKEELNSRFRPSLKDFMDNSIMHALNRVIQNVKECQ
jgi:hypothetical protein